jgi:hypothetical protein
VFCPRCGDENPDGVRYCSSCGSALPRLTEEPEPAPAGGLRGRIAHRLRRLVGRTRRERVVSGVTVSLLVVAVVAFLVLDTPEEELPANPARDTLDQACVTAKAQVVEAANALAGTDGADAYSLGVVIAMQDLRDAATESGLPDVADLRTAAFDAAVAAGRFGRLAREEAPGESLQEALTRSTDALTALSEPTEDLGLDRCAATLIEQPG